MPISTSRVMEESQMSTTHFGDDDSHQPPKLDPKFFEEIGEMFHTIKVCQKEEDDCKRKAEEIDRRLEEARATIEKAKQGRDALRKRNEFLQDKLDQRERRVEQAVQYWKDYGLDDIKQTSENQYEFIYTKPVSCSVNLRFHDDKLEVVEHTPELTSVEELNERLTSCVRKDHIDYKLAMILIKKQLAKDAPKTSSRQ